MTRSNTKRVTSTLLLSLTLTSFVSGCGDDGAASNYEIPDAICDTRIDPDALGEILPGGDAFESGSRGLRGAESCDVRIDGKLRMSITGHSSAEFEDPRERALQNGAEDPAPLEGIEAGGGVTWGEGAVVSWECHNDESRLDYKYPVVVINVLSDEGKSDEGRRGIEEFTLSYIAGLAEKLQCDM